MVAWRQGFDREPLKNFNLTETTRLTFLAGPRRKGRLREAFVRPAGSYDGSSIRQFQVRTYKRSRLTRGSFHAVIADQVRSEGSMK